MVQNPSSEANWFAASQEIIHISRNPKVHYRTHKRPPPVSISSIAYIQIGYRKKYVIYPSIHYTLYTVCAMNILKKYFLAIWRYNILFARYCTPCFMTLQTELLILYRNHYKHDCDFTHERSCIVTMETGL